jgi:hypothetical protein
VLARPLKTWTNWGEIHKMVDVIRELAAKLGNEKVFKWAIRNNFYIEKISKRTYSKMLQRMDTLKCWN